VVCGNKSDTGNDRGDWNHFKITQTIPEQHNRKARNKGTIKNSLIGHYTRTAGIANVKVQTIFNVRSNIACTTNCKYRTDGTVYTLETWFVMYIIVNTLHNGDNKDDDDDNDDDNNNNNKKKKKKNK
jgi:hypothetical protein